MGYEHIHMPFTIERQLKEYASHPAHEEQHEVLWNAWNTNKQILSRILRWTLVSFPMYSRHDESHANAVLRNIERVLGEERIKTLSPTDCFVLLHIAYEHDIGMCITNADRQRMINDPRFLEMVEELSHDTDSIMANYAQIVKKVCSDSSVFSEDDGRRVLQRSLEIYHAMTALLATYQRMDHGEISKERVSSAQGIFNYEISRVDIPTRVFRWIAECAGLHTVWGFDNILALPYEDDGAASDKMHPRFAAIMLQLGDALDMDNGRFPIAMEDFVGDVPEITRLHMQKHEAIRMLHIGDKLIEVQADCESHEVSRIIQAECKGINELLKEASYHWGEIVPEGMPGTLPAFRLSRVTVKGTDIPEALISASFNISQQKAFSLLEGSHIYADRFAFLREILQNAFDASKMQYWNDYLGSIHPSVECTNRRMENEEVFNAVKTLSFVNYPIQVRLTVCGITENGEWKCPSDTSSAERLLETLNATDDSMMEFGVLVEVQDVGTGISEKDIKHIAELGSKDKNNEELKSLIPEMIYPTGSFGIGLQSVFLISNSFYVDTRTRAGEAYRIRFSSMTGREKGIINTMLLPNIHAHPFGTTVTVLVPSKFRLRDNAYYAAAKINADIFSTSNAEQKVHEAEELMVQMVMYMNMLVGQKVFPIHVQTTDMFAKREHPYLEKLRKSEELGVVLTNRTQENIETTASIRNIRDEERNSIAWVFRDEATIDPMIISGKLDNGDRYCFDLKQCKMHVWCNEIGAFAGFDANKFCEILSSKDRDQDVIDTRAPLFYKGIKMLDKVSLKRDLGLIAYIDLKSERTADILQLNRQYLTDEGKAYFSNTVETAISKTVSKVFEKLGNQEDEEYGRGLISRKITERCEVLCKNIYQDLDIWTDEDTYVDNCKKLASLIMLVFQGKVATTIMNINSCEYEDVISDKCPWNSLLKKINGIMKQNSMKLENTPNAYWNRIPPYIWLCVHDMRMREDRILVESLAELLLFESKYVITVLEEGTHRDTKEYRIYKESKLKTEQQVVDSIKVLLTKANKYDASRRVRLGTLSVETNEAYDYGVRLAKWILDNVPTKEILQCKTGTLGEQTLSARVLSMSSIDFIRTDMGTKYDLLLKMKEMGKDQPIQRFCTIVWDKRFKNLAVSENIVERLPVVQPDNIAASSCPMMVIPCCYQDLEALFNYRTEMLLERLKLDNYSFDKFKHRWSEYVSIRNRILESIRNDSLKLIIDDWMKKKEHLPSYSVEDRQVFPRQWIEDFWKGIEPIDIDDLENISGAEFQRYLHKVTECINKSANRLIESVNELWEDLPTLRPDQGKVFSSKENVAKVLRILTYDEEFMKENLVEIYKELHMARVDEWKSKRETQALVDCISQESTSKISRECAMRQNELLYWQIIEVIGQAEVSRVFQKRVPISGK